MSNSIRHDFHSDLATIVANEIQYQKSNYYYFLGKIDSWGTIDSPAILPELDSDYINNNIRSNIVFMKKIVPNDISLVTTRYNWTSGLIYDLWDHTRDMSSLQFFCVTSDNLVYKCLDNNKASVSTVMPSGTSFYAFKTLDGYTWKYMYTVSTSKRSRFMSVSHMPVQTALSDSFYNKGSIDEVVVVSSGSGYADVQQTFITVNGTTSGSGATGTITVNNISGVTGIDITNGGSGYTHGVDVTIVSAHGIGAIVEAVITLGVITGITVITPGINYTVGESYEFSVGGALIIPNISRLTHSIVDLTIKKPGNGYTATPTLTVTDITGLGTGAYGNLTALVSAITFNGKIVRANIIDPGTNYSVDTATTISILGDGIDAVFTPVVFNGEIVNIIVENAGTGYTTAILNVVGAGTGAKLNSMISVSDFISDQSIVEQTSEPGAVYSVQIVEPGNYYSNNTVVSIVGDGTGCEAYVELALDGSIHNVVVTSYGQGYSYANVTFIDASRNIISNKIDASAYITLPPQYGHGRNAVKELFGKSIAINTSLRRENLLIDAAQDFRQFGIIKGATNIVTGKKISNSAYMLVYDIIVTDTSGMLIDEILIQNNIKFRVVSILDKNVSLQQLGDGGLVNILNLYAESNAIRVYSVSSIINFPVANKYSGSLLYVSDEAPFVFTENQGITIKTFLKF